MKFFTSKNLSGYYYLVQNKEKLTQHFKNWLKIKEKSAQNFENFIV